MDEDALESEKKQLQKVIKKCKDEIEYQTWKNAFVIDAYDKIQNQKFLTIKYLFAGIGQYEATIPEDQKEGFMCWINGNGSAFCGDEREATPEEVKKYIALHASDE